ncbi:MAG TPA: hypothetical protein DD640_09445, partial [Clostridiales bacterium]|nr:hypothetical protein [Clostridiales bacterium]
MKKRSLLLMLIWLIMTALIFQIPPVPMLLQQMGSSLFIKPRVAAFGGNYTRPPTPTPIIPRPTLTPIIDRPTPTPIISWPSSTTVFQISVLEYEDAVLPDKTFAINFTSPVDVLTVAGNIKVTDSSGQDVPVNCTTVLPDCRKVMVSPQTDYLPGEYVLKTLAGIKDMAGRSPAGGIEIHFTVAGVPLPDAIQISPLQVSLQPGQQTTFSAIFVGGTSSQPLNWRVIAGDNSSEFAGSISEDGTYQAPMQPGQYTVEVRSAEFPSLSAWSVVVVEAPPAGSIDLALGLTCLNIPGNTHPGDPITFKARVLNNSAAGQCPGGTIVRFLINGRVIDEVPIYIEADQAYAEARIWYYMPETSDYSAMVQGDTIPVTVSVMIDPYNRLDEIDETNNSASSTMNVLYAYDTPLQDTDPQLYVDATSLSVWSTKDDAPANRLSAAQPGQKLRLKALVYYVGSDRSEDINIKFLINGQVIFDDNRRVGVLGGNFEATCNYQVPFNCTEQLDFQVLLSNGSIASIQVPVQRYDVGIMPGDLYWANDELAVPGENLYLHALIKNISSIRFPHEDARIAWRALINGQKFAEGDYKLDANELNVSLPVFPVPLNQTGPILLTIITDVYDQLDEDDETNNIASILIPLAGDYQLGSNLYVDAVDLLNQPKLVVPGSTLTLSADIHKEGLAPLTRDVLVQFKVNGLIIASKTVARGLFRPMQAHQVKVDWTDTIGLPPGETTFEVIIDPENFIAESNENDNQAEKALSVAKPDLDVTGNSIQWDPEQPATGTAVHLKAIIANTGDGPAINTKIRFYADGQEIGTRDATVDQINSASAAYAELDWNIPATPMLYIPYSTLIGYTGKRAVPEEVTKKINLTVKVDPDQQITEKNETNNESPGKIISVVIPTERKFVYIQAVDSISSVSDASVTLTAENGEIASAMTDSDGWCSFTGVPTGNYTIKIEKEYYHTYTAGGQVMTTSAPQYRKFLVSRTSDFIGMSGLDSDGDMISDVDEREFYHTKANDADSDDDGVIDGRDLAPLTNPKNPEQTFLQQKGMIRYDQAVSLHGLDGKVDIYDWEYHVSTWSSSLDYSCTYENQGTYTSKMDSEHYTASINDAYDSLGFEVYA